MEVDAAFYLNKKVGDSVKCPNPGHKDKHPSAILNATNVFCFACGESFFFNKLDEKHTRIYKNNDDFAKKFHDNLIKASDRSPIKEYLQTRNLDDKGTIEYFQLGFDANKNMLVFPIKTLKSYISGFGFRRIDDKGPKYINSHGTDKDENSVFIKSENLYGIEKITDKCDHLIICEGYLDVISAFKNGFNSSTRFVALMGTALTEEHIPVLKTAIKTRKIQKISLMLDNDIAGEKATFAAIQTLLSGNIFPNVIKNINEKREQRDLFGGECDKDVDEILRRKDGKSYLDELIKNNCHDWFDYLIYLKDNWEDFLKESILLIQDNEIKGKYAFKFCERLNLHAELKPIKHESYNNVLSLNDRQIKEYFLKEEHYFNCKLPYYFGFQDILSWAKKKADIYSEVDFKKLENVNYTIFGNKNGEYAWRKYQIINPILYVKLVNLISQNWTEVKKYFEESKKISDRIKCVSIPVIENKNDDFANNTARQIIHWWDKVEQDSIKKSINYKCIIKTDIVDCYGAIYTHSIAWALHGKKTAKDRSSDTTLLGNKIDWLLQAMSNGQTNGIPQGSVLMDFIAEILLAFIDKQLCEKCSDIRDYYVLRYRDDYRIFTNEVNTARKILKYLSEILLETGGMRLSPEKTDVSNCLVSSSIKKDKLHYFEYFKDFKKSKGLRQDILNIYLFAKKYPNSGSILKLLQLFQEKINIRIGKISLFLLNGKADVEVFDTHYVISILSEILYLHPRTYNIACSIIWSIATIIENKERKKIFECIRKKMQDVPNNELLCIWLERMVYINYNDTEGWAEFINTISKDKTLLYKAYKKESIWTFPSKVDLTELDVSTIIDKNKTDNLDRATKREIQEINVNKAFTDEETNPFYSYT